MWPGNNNYSKGNKIRRYLKSCELYEYDILISCSIDIYYIQKGAYSRVRAKSVGLNQRSATASLYTIGTVLLAPPFRHGTRFILQIENQI